MIDTRFFLGGGGSGTGKDGVMKRLLLNLSCFCAVTAAMTPVPGRASQENYEAVLADPYVAPIPNVPGDLGGRGLANAQEAVGGLATLLANDPFFGIPTLNVLIPLTPSQKTQFFSQVQPSMIGSAQALTSGVLNANGGFFGAVDGRLLTARQTDGLSAGDDVGRGYTVWAMPYGDVATQRMSDGVGGYTASSYGVAIGGDSLVRPDLRIGAAVALSNTDIAFSDSLAGNKSHVLTTQAGVYGTWYVGHLFVDGAAAVGYSWYNASEDISAFGSIRSSGYTGTQVSAKVSAGYDFQIHGVQITPSVGVQEVHLNIAPYTTSGGGSFDLSVAGQSIDVTQMKIGSRFAYPMSQGNGWSFTPDVHGYYVRNLNTTRISTSASFLGGGSFTVTAPARDPDIAVLGVGLTVTRNGPFVVSALYDYAFGRTTSDNKFFLRAKREF